VSNALRGAASQLSDGEMLAVEPISAYSSDDLAYTVEIGRTRGNLGGGPEPATVSLA
jgi:hypothetical protein